jgi:MFS family permease
MGYYQLSATLATAIGPFVAIILSELGNYTLIFFLCSGLLVLALLLMPFLKLRTIVLTAEERETFTGLKLVSIIEKPVLPASAVAALTFISYGAIVAFLALFTRDIGIPGTATWFFLAFAVAVLLSRPFVSKQFDRRGALPILVPALIVLTIGFVLLSQAHGLVLLIVSAVVIGLGHGAVTAVTIAIVAKITPPYRRGVGNTTYFLLSDICYAFGPILSGFILPLTGFRVLYLLMGGVILCTLALSCIKRASLNGEAG